ncbi:hypothetical protein BV25DRAFT_1840063 [Artomyces pyxidatus]|uniref:Uncharacterized protein n=1 Tax=Artomyces pyxidatus TaxID=48021 RepID=A0ACB8SVA7_9AGAM|nr:hypothetical protein BV25DRAFT_1840063 [Artomyces pyxidatus]
MSHSSFAFSSYSSLSSALLDDAQQDLPDRCDSSYGPLAPQPPLNTVDFPVEINKDLSRALDQRQSAHTQAYYPSTTLPDFLPQSFGDSQPHHRTQRPTQDLFSYASSQPNYASAYESVVVDPGPAPAPMHSPSTISYPDDSAHQVYNAGIMYTSPTEQGLSQQSTPATGKFCRDYEDPRSMTSSVTDYHQNLHQLVKTQQSSKYLPIVQQYTRMHDAVHNGLPPQTVTYSGPLASQARPELSQNFDTGELSRPGLPMNSSTTWWEGESQAKRSDMSSWNGNGTWEHATGASFSSASARLSAVRPTEETHQGGLLQPRHPPAQHARARNPGTGMEAPGRNLAAAASAGAESYMLSGGIPGHSLGHDEQWGRRVEAAVPHRAGALQDAVLQVRGEQETLTQAKTLPWWMQYPPKYTKNGRACFIYEHDNPQGHEEPVDECRHCGRVFWGKSERRRHQGLPAQCGLCGEWFSREESVDRHQKALHWIFNM